MSEDLLNSVAAATVHRDRDDLDKAFAHLLLQLLESQWISLYRIIEDTGAKRVARRLSIHQSWGEVGAEGLDDLSVLPCVTDQPSWQECFTRRQVVHCQIDAGRYLTTFPVVGGSDVCGFLVIEGATALTQRESGLVDGFLRILRNHLAILDYGELDTLTGLFNRKTLEGNFEKLRVQLSPRESVLGLSVPPRSVRAREPAWLGLIDIDHFKSINDGFGHLFGDEVLLLVSQLMKRSFRGSDQLFRFGGEEFVVLLDHASEAGAQIVFERLRANVDAYQFPQVGHVTISLGYTQIQPQDVPTLCVERADAALYFAKTHGRNSVHRWEALVASGDVTPPQSTTGEIEMF